MIRHTLDELKRSIDELNDISPEKKSAILNQMRMLETELGENEPVAERGRLLSEEFQELEISHPELTDLANRLCMMLANIGI